MAQYLTWKPHQLALRIESLIVSEHARMSSGLARYSTSSPNYLSQNSRGMTSHIHDKQHVFFGPFDVTPQVFYRTPLSFGIVNLKPLLPGHVLISPLRVVQRLTDLSTHEVADLFIAVVKVQKMLARVYFKSQEDELIGEPMDGSFNIAIQDGADAGQSVPHVHCHIIPRLKGDDTGDEVYDRLASDEGNVGGALWDRDHRPRNRAQFPKIEDSARQPRSAEEMTKEAQFFREKMEELGS